MDATKLMSLLKDKKQSLKQKVKTLKPNPGANSYVFLPGWLETDRDTFWHDFGQHYVKNAAGEIQAVYPCLDKTYGNPCPVCDGLNKAIRMTTDDDTVALLKEAASGQSYLFNVLALGTPDESTPQILEIRKSVFSQLVEIIEAWGMAVFDPESPQIITIQRDGKGLNTKYSVQISPKKHKLPAGILSKLNNLSEYVKQESEEQQRRTLSAISNVAGLLPSSVATGAAGSTIPADVPRTVSADDAAADASLRSMERAAMAASKPVSSEIALDDELDSLLGELAEPVAA